MVLHEHHDPPGQVRAPVADPQRRQRRAGAADPREADEVRGVVLGRARGGGPGVGEVVLAEAELPPQPPEQGLVEEDEPRQAGEVPRPGVAPLDVRPLVRQDVPEGPGLAPGAERRRQEDHRAGPGVGERQGDPVAFEEDDPLAPGPGEAEEDVADRSRDGASRPGHPPEHDLPDEPPGRQPGRRRRDNTPSGPSARGDSPPPPGGGLHRCRWGRG